MWENWVVSYRFPEVRVSIAVLFSCFHMHNFVRIRVSYQVSYAYQIGVECSMQSTCHLLRDSDIYHATDKLDDDSHNMAVIMLRYCTHKIHSSTPKMHIAVYCQSKQPGYSIFSYINHKQSCTLYTHNKRRCEFAN